MSVQLTTPQYLNTAARVQQVFNSRRNAEVLRHSCPNHKGPLFPHAPVRNPAAVPDSSIAHTPGLDLWAQGRPPDSRRPALSTAFRLHGPQVDKGSDVEVNHWGWYSRCLNWRMRCLYSIAISCQWFSGAWLTVRFSSRERKLGFQRCGPLGWENPQLDPWSPNWGMHGDLLEIQGENTSLCIYLYF